MKKQTFVIAVVFLLSMLFGFLWYFVVEFAEGTLSLSGRGVAIIGVGMMLVLSIVAVLPWIYKVQQITHTLATLNAGKHVAPIPMWRVWLLSPLITEVNTVIENRQEFQIAKDRLYDQISEVAAQEERKRLARDLHDSIKQQVFSISISAAAAQAHLDSNPTAAREALLDVKQSAQEAMVEMRALLQQLAPAPLEKSGLVEALREQVEALSYRTGARVETTFGALPPDDVLPIGTQEALFRIAQEALSNIARHARAKHVTLALHAADEQLTLHIRDDGQGFDPDTAARGMGLGNIERRVSDINGADVTIDSATGNGTTVTVTVPLYEPTADEAKVNQQFDAAKTLVDSVVRYWNAANGGLAMSILLMSLSLRLILRGESVALIATFTAVSILALLVGEWGRRRYRDRFMTFDETVSDDHPLHDFLQMHRHQGIWMVWGGMYFMLPGLLIAPAFPAWLSTAFASVPFMALIWHLLGSERLRQRYVAGLPATKRADRLADRKTEIRMGWAMLLLMSLTILVPGTGSGIYLLPTTSEQWDSNFFLSLLLILTGYQCHVSWIYWKYTRQSTERKEYA